MGNSYFKNSIGLRLGIIAALTILLLIPALMIQSLISERQERRDEAVTDVFNKWGNVQTISGPILTVPYNTLVRYEDGKTLTVKRFAHLLPSNLNVDGTILPEIRYRGIYETVLYNTNFTVEGNFLPKEMESLNIKKEEFLLNEAFVSVGITDMKGIKELIHISWNEEKLTANPGIKSNDILSSGVSADLPLLNFENKYNFSLAMNINGSESLFYTPLGVETNVKLKSDWANPSFTGDFLPEKRTVNEKGFEAEWHVLHLNRNFPQTWSGNAHDINKSAFGVKMLIPVDEYQKTMRTAKYAILYIALTFLTFFMIELLNSKVIHPVQYLLIGFALLIFYSLLLAITEHLLFDLAYLFSGLAIIALVTAYTKSVLKSNTHTFIISGVLTLLYGYLFIILQLQDYALLMGSIGLFIILAAVMYLTRKVDWFSIKQAQNNNQH